jgi:chromosome segregation ATPase
VPAVLAALCARRAGPVPGDSSTEAITEVLTWLEQQVRLGREDQARTTAHVEQLRRQMLDLMDDVSATERALREVDPKFLPFKGLPEKINALDAASESTRQDLGAYRSEVDSALRILRAEAEYDREERGNVFRRIETAASQVSLAMADVAQVQAQASQLGQGMQTLLERQREVEARVQQLSLRLDRSIEVHRDLEERVREVLTAEQHERFEVVFERLQVVGEMVKRNEDLINAVAAQRSLREEVLQEIAVWRDQHTRIDGRINVIEELSDRLLGDVDKLRGAITLLEGRHSGLGERVGGIRRDIAEVVDHVREEFAKYNQMMEKQRRKQIQMLEQELREMKFHAFRPPDEP